MEQVINKQIHTFKTVFREMPSALLRTVKYVSYFITAHSFAVLLGFKERNLRKALHSCNDFISCIYMNLRLFKGSQL
jgi:hypothetical protein